MDLNKDEDLRKLLLLKAFTEALMKLLTRFILTIIFLALVSLLFIGCMQNKIRKPKNIEEAGNIIHDLQAQFPNLIKEDSTETVDTTKKLTTLTIDIQKDSIKYLSKTLDSVFNELKKDCHQITKIEQVYKDKIINSCSLENEIKSFEFDSAGIKAKLKTINGKIKLQISIESLEIKKEKAKVVYVPCKTLKYYEKVLEVWELFLLMLILISILVILNKVKRKK